jgi:hypothetical protein
MRLVSRAMALALPLAAAGSLFVLAAPVCAQENGYSQQLDDVRAAIGLGKDRDPIDFRERPPLAVPPTNNLPPPVTAAPSLGVNDPDVDSRRKALSDSRRPVPPTDPGANASGLNSRTYLIDPPAGMRDPSAVSAGIETDKSVPGAPKAARKHHARRKAAPVAAEQ